MKKRPTAKNHRPLQDAHEQAKALGERVGELERRFILSTAQMTEVAKQRDLQATRANHFEIQLRAIIDALLLIATGATQRLPRKE